MMKLRDEGWHDSGALTGEWAWQTQGLCRQLPPEVFFPEDEGRLGRRTRELRAKQICRGCPVVERCRDHALTMRETHGVWGAMSAQDRARALVTRASAQ